MNDSKGPTIIIVLLIAVAVVAGGIFLMGRNDEATNQSESVTTSETPTQEEAQPQADIVSLAAATPTLSTLVTAVTTAELVETLQGEGPFTVFAPSNAAFDALPAGTVNTLLQPENREQLTTILTYHVVPGRVAAADLSDGQQITTVQGGTLTVSIENNNVYLVDAMQNRVMVEQADVRASNGIVHIINGVLMPQ